MKKVLFLITSLCLFSIAAKSQTNYNRLLNDTALEYFESVVLCDSGKYLAAGTTSSTSVGGTDVLLVMFNADGTIAWKKTYGTGLDDTGKGVAACPTGGFIIVANSVVFGPGNQTDVLLIRIDQAGNIIWSRTYGGMANDAGNDVKVLSDGRICVAGMSQSFGIVPQSAFGLMVDDIGDIYFSNIYSQNQFNNFNDVLITADGSLLFTGSATGFDSLDYDGYAVKTDLGGNILWSKRTGGTGSDVFEGASENDFDSTYILTGSSTSGSAGGTDAWIYTVRQTDGTAVNGGFFGNAGDDAGTSVMPFIFGQYLISGYTTVNNYECNLLARFDPTSYSIGWAAAEGDSTGHSRMHAMILDSAVSSIQVGGTDGYLHTEGQAEVIKSEPGLTMGCTQTIAQFTLDTMIFPDSSGTDMISLVMLPVDITVSWLQPFLSNTDWCQFIGINETADDEHAVTLYPNPADDMFSIKFGKPGRYTVTVKDAGGRICLVQNDVITDTPINISALAGGYYITEISDGISFSVARLIISR